MSPFYIISVRSENPKPRPEKPKAKPASRRRKPRARFADQTAEWAMFQALYAADVAARLGRTA